MPEDKKSLVKDNLTTILSIGTTLSAIIGGWLFFDERYAHAQVVQKMASEQAQQIQQLNFDSEVRYRQMERNSIDDKIFYLEIKPNRTATDEALLNRHKQQRLDVERALQELRR